MERRGHWSNAGALLALLATSFWGCVKVPEQDSASRPESRPVPERLLPERTVRFERLRPPVLGFALESDPARECYRLVATEENDRVLCIGTRESCEAALIAALESRHGNAEDTFPMFTLGGKQFWEDRFVYQGWRIQRNIFSGDCRLLDPRDIRRAKGDEEECRIAFEERRIRDGIRRRSADIVVLIHGLGRSKDSFDKMEKALERAGYEVEAINYPSTRRDIRDHASQIRDVLDGLEDANRVSFVTHSLGGIVVRELLALDGSWKERIQIGRVVMLAPPNQGSILAETMKDWTPFQLIAGEVGQQLTPGEIGAFPRPCCEFGIIAGGTGRPTGINPFLDGDNDGVVTVESTRLDGASDFLRIHAEHTFIMNHRDCIRATIRFLGSGRFDEETL